MKVVFSNKAYQDLEQIGDYIAQDNPLRAVTFVSELRKVALAIGDASCGFPLVAGRETQGIRRRPYGNYIIYYIVAVDRVVILHFLHAARDHEGLI